MCHKSRTSTARLDSGETLPRAVASSVLAYTLEDDHRSSESVAYIHPIVEGKVKRPILIILQNTWVSRILIQGTTATGITATTKASDVYSLSARSEIVLCAGTIATP